jgi:anti-anti-sigma factor
MQVQALKIEQCEREDHHALVLQGELDINTAPDLESALVRLCDAGVREIEIDLRGLTFIDSTGIRAILSAQEQCEEHHAAFFLVPGRHTGVNRVFEILGLASLPWRPGGEMASVGRRVERRKDAPRSG